VSDFALVVVANGRGALLEQTMAALDRNLTPRPPVVLICDDSGDPAFAAWLRERWPQARIDAHRHLGHGPAVRRAWDLARDLPARWVFWMEEDMILDRPLDLRDPAGVLEVTPGLAQVVLNRNAHFPAEVAAGPTMIDRFDPATFQPMVTHGHPWLRHRAFYSLNPHIVPVPFLKGHRWPPVPNSEHRFSLGLFRDPKVFVGLWGSRGDPPLVLHAGTERTGTGY
jgi:hypothetical protein